MSRPATPEEAFYLKLIKGDELDAVKPPMGGDVLYDMPKLNEKGEETGKVLVLFEPVANRTTERRLVMVEDRVTPDGTVRKLLTPFMTLDEITTVAEQVMVGNQRVTTWSFTPRVLAIAAAMLVA